MQSNVDILLNTLIKNQKDAIKYQTVFASFILLAGICLIVFTSFFHFKSDDTLKSIMSIGGLLISTISTYPISQIINRNEKKKIYETLSSKLKDMAQDERKRVEEFVWSSIVKL